MALPGVDGWYPTGVAGKAGMVLQQLPPYGNHGNQLELWNPLTDRVVHVFVNAYVLGTGGDSVVWETAAPYCRTNCPLHVLNALNRVSANGTTSFGRHAELATSRSRRMVARSPPRLHSVTHLAFPTPKRSS